MRVHCKPKLKSSLIKVKGGSGWWRKSKQHRWARRVSEPIGEDGGGFKEETAGLRGKSGYPLLENTDQVATDDTQCCIWPSAHMPTNPAPPLQHPYSKTPTIPHPSRRGHSVLCLSQCSQGFIPYHPLYSFSMNWPDLERSMGTYKTKTQSSLLRIDRIFFFFQTSWWSIIGWKFCLVCWMYCLCKAQ